MKLAAPLKFGVGVKVMSLPDRLTVPPTAPPTAVMAGVPSKLSLARRLAAVMTIAVSSLVLAVSAAMSATAFTVSAITCVLVLPASSVMVTVKLSKPL